MIASFVLSVLNQIKFNPNKIADLHTKFYISWLLPLSIAQLALSTLFTASYYFKIIHVGEILIDRPELYDAIVLWYT